MKTSTATFLSLVALCALAFSDVADARGRHHHHHHHRGHVGIWFGAPLFPYYSPYYYPRYYYPPTVVAPAAPPVYIEQGSAAPVVAPGPSAPSAQTSGAFWYYCPDSRTYYPYVQSCATPWQQVVPQTTPPS